MGIEFGSMLHAAGTDVTAYQQRLTSAIALPSRFPTALKFTKETFDHASESYMPILHKIEASYGLILRVAAWGVEFNRTLEPLQMDDQSVLTRAGYRMLFGIRLAELYGVGQDCKKLSPDSYNFQGYNIAQMGDDFLQMVSDYEDKYLLPFEDVRFTDEYLAERNIKSPPLRALLVPSKTTNVEVFAGLITPYALEDESQTVEVLERVKRNGRKISNERFGIDDVAFMSFEALRTLELLENPHTSLEGLEEEVVAMTQIMRRELAEKKIRLRLVLYNPSDAKLGETQELLELTDHYLQTGLRDRVLELWGLTDPTHFARNWDRLNKLAKGSSLHEYSAVLQAVREYASNNPELSEIINAPVHQILVEPVRVGQKKVRLMPIWEQRKDVDVPAGETEIKAVYRPVEAVLEDMNLHPQVRLQLTQAVSKFDPSTLIFKGVGELVHDPRLSVKFRGNVHQLEIKWCENAAGQYLIVSGIRIHPA